MVGNDRDATVALWTLVVLQRTLVKLLWLEEKHACLTGHMIATLKCNLADHSMPSEIEASILLRVLLSVASTPDDYAYVL